VTAAVSREGWILIGFVALAVAALTVSAAGWILLVRDRRVRRTAGAGAEGPSAAPSQG
jgi:hypothetical protein